MKTDTVHVRKLAAFSVFTALAIAMSPFTGFAVSGTIANPTQHMINAILGVLLGPFWAVLGAVIIGAARNMLGVGTLFAFPGGIPGGFVVGSVYWILKRFKINEKKRLMSALTEPIGTMLIGVPISLLMFAPWLGKHIASFALFVSGWALSCIPGCIIGFTVLLTLKRIGISRETLFGEE
jgi:energy coupling factor transporter S component ThiW